MTPLRRKIITKNCLDSVYILFFNYYAPCICDSTYCGKHVINYIRSDSVNSIMMVISTNVNREYK